MPNGNEITVNPGTIKKWYLDYCKDGFECLKPKSRKDTGCSRTVPIECIDKIIEFKEKYPYITGKAIYNKLIEDGDILAKNVSLAPYHISAPLPAEVRWGLFPLLFSAVPAVSAFLFTCLSVPSLPLFYPTKCTCVKDI